MDYHKGKIYKILNTLDDDCYIGCTTQTLSKRMATHRKTLQTSWFIRSSSPSWVPRDPPTIPPEDMTLPRNCNGSCGLAL